MGTQRSDTGDQSARLMRRATYASVTVAMTLVVAKLVAWVLTDSVALLSTLIDSLIDVGASLVTLLAVREALTPADEEHRFGHGKAEPLAGLGQAAFIAGSGIFLVIEAAGRLTAPLPVQRGEIGIAVMVFSILATIGLVAYQRRVIAQTKSVAISADSLHYAGDLLINLSVIVSLGLAMTVDLPILDPLFAIAIALWLMKNAWTIGANSVNLLMDRELPPEDRVRIIKLALENPRVFDIHDLRTRSSGPQTFIQLNVELDGEMTLSASHAIVTEIENRLRATFPGAEVLIHQDPAGIQEDHHPDFAYEDTSALLEADAASQPRRL
ncbi:divalent metal cation transporter FieF [Rhodospirillum rubrum]|uniref:cation diffusion facilitator family transporter n=1 Tax=Rhodospirillum rubrum TaxID=1085 RepID=UPI0019071CA0|nr:cation diffusion facilitator family transporter [Rhodospirillum rubrum]MBK1665318.1 divalent metal cation transporter FieF [Rhodospirillum rubrum]MBK1676506.1 divalent metal cation transporter FieF [Rhodospirillum rubrum]